MPVGNPAEPALIELGLIFEESPYVSFRTSYISNYIVRAKYQNQNGIDINSSYTNYVGKAILNILRKADIYAFVGAARGDSVLVNNTSKIDIYQKQMISAGGGVKAIVYECHECYFIGVDAKYFRYYPSIDHILVNEVPINITQSILKTWQWEFSAAFAKRFSLFTPYIGTSYLIARQKLLNNTSFSTNAKQVNPFGLFLGTTMTYRDAISLNAEAKFFNQIEYGISAEFSF
jgi:hypothetical protein